MSTINQTVSPDELTIFDEEMAFLSSIQTRFFNMHNRIPVAQDDPDVKHLTEVMAAFMAKGRMAGRQQIDQLHQRVFQQLLPYLTSPVASMALVQANTRYLTEAVELKSGSLFTLSSDDGEQAQYRSIASMPLAPIAIERVGCKPNGRIENQVFIRIISHVRAPGPLVHLPIFLTVNKNFNMSLVLKELFKKQLIKVSAIFDESINLDGQFSLGACQAIAEFSDKILPQHKLLQASQQAEGSHPIEKIRRFFQLPQQENYLNLYFTDAPQQWKSCELVLTLRGQWPQQLKISSELFQLAVISVENILQEYAEPIQYNATQSSCPVRPPSTAADLHLLKCLGVYQGVLKDRVSLRPGILKGGSDAYELQFQSRSSQGPAYPQLDIQLPEAFKKPVKITVDGLWHQPDFSKSLWKKLAVRTHHLDIPGLIWNIFTAPVAYIPLRDNDPQSLLELSLLKNKSEVSLDEILFLLESLGSVFQREFQPIKPLLKSLHIALAGKNNGSNLLEQELSRKCVNYHFSLHAIPANSLPLINTFFAKLEALLNVWLANIRINVSIQNPMPATEEPSLQPANQYNFIGYSETPIHDNDADVIDKADYRLIPQSPEQLFFIGEQNVNSFLFKSSNGYEE
ncbi:MAG: type VI secretion system baseplate subunit TssF [Pseudomonadota bacterium]